MRAGLLVRAGPVTHSSPWDNSFLHPAVTKPVNWTSKAKNVYLLASLSLFPGGALRGVGQGRGWVPPARREDQQGCRIEQTETAGRGHTGRRKHVSPGERHVAAEILFPLSTGLGAGSSARPTRPYRSQLTSLHRPHPHLTSPCQSNQTSPLLLAEL